MSATMTATTDGTTGTAGGARRWARAMAIYAALSLAIIAAGGWLFGLAFPTPAERRAVLVSAGLAFVVQLVTFALARRTAGTNPFAGYGLGMLLRFATLFVYAFVAVGRLGLPSTAALLSLATFFFVSTLVEPPLLKL
jgi:hypothetical protein